MKKTFLFFVFIVIMLFSCSTKLGLGQSIDQEHQEQLMTQYKQIQKYKTEYKKAENFKKFLTKLDTSFTHVLYATYALKNNNPGNLRHFTKKTGYRYFKTMKDGYDALIADLEYKINGRSCHTDSTTTISKFVNIYAPKHENNTDKYVKYVCKAMGVKETDKLYTIKDVHRLAKVIIYMEDQNVYTAIYQKDKQFESLMKKNNLVYCNVNDNVMLALK